MLIAFPLVCGCVATRDTNPIIGPRQLVGFRYVGNRSMTTLTKPTTLNECDEALMHLALVNESDRGPAWRAYSDAILEMRQRLA